MLNFFGGWVRLERVSIIMWRTTGDVKWRDRGYEIFQAIEKHARTKFGCSTVRGIDGLAQQLDDMLKVCNIFITFFSAMGYLFVQLGSS